MKVGQIVRLSQVGLAEQWWPSCHVNRPQRLRGTVVRIARGTGTVYVLWHPWKTPQTYAAGHVQGLEVVEGEPGVAEQSEPATTSPPFNPSPDEE